MRDSYLRRRLRSFRHAWDGARHLLRTQPNARIHLAATVLAVAGGIVCGLDALEWTALLIVTGMVWTAEAFNTALELLADEVSLEKRERLGQAKDTAAFVVLASAIVAALVGVVIFGRHLLA